MRANLGFLFVVLVVCVETASAQTSYKAVDIGTLGGDETVSAGINNDGKVVGYSETLDSPCHPFIFDYDKETGEGKITDLGLLPGHSWGKAFGINDSGSAVGFCRSASDADHAFLYKDGAMINIGVFGSTWSRAMGINAGGEAIVQYSGGPNIAGSFIYNNGTVTSLGNSTANAINDNGQVVGKYGFDVEEIQTAFFYSGGVMHNLGALGGDFTQSEAYGLNDKGQIVGVSWTPPSDGGLVIKHAFLWEEGTGMTDLGTLGGNESWATSINNIGEIVGTSFTIGSNPDSQVGFLWQESNGMQDLSTLAGIDVSSAEGINDAGYIADASGGAYLLVPIVPEPSTFVLLIIGSISFVAYFWRCQKH